MIKNSIKEEARAVSTHKSRKTANTVEPVTNSATDYSSYDGGMSMKTAERNSSLGQGFPSAKLEFQLLTRGIVLNKL
jgi:hypothetical protein